MPTRLVLNWHHFIEAVFPGTIRELGYPELSHQLLSAVKRNGHRILITRRKRGKQERPSIYREYVTELNRRKELRGFRPQLAIVMGQLRDQDLVEVLEDVPNVNVAGLPRGHQIFFEHAIAGSAQYLVTERQEWLRLNTDRQISRKLTILTADDYIHR